MKIEYFKRKSGSSTVLTDYLVSLLRTVPEYTWYQTERSALHNMLDLLESHPRIELRWGTPTHGGCASIVVEQNFHVGRCVTIEGIFSNTKSAPIRRLIKAAKAIAVENDIPVIAYCKRIGPGLYVNKFVRINHGKSR